MGGGQSDRSIGGPSDDGKRLPTTKRGQHTKVLADRAHNEMTLTRPPKKGGGSSNGNGARGAI